MKVIYKSFDNKEFETKQECRAYEENKIKIRKNTRFFDKNFDEMSPEYIRNSRVADKIMYIIYDPNDSADEIENFMNEFGEYVTPWDNGDFCYDYNAGFYWYDKEQCRWFHYESMAEQVEKMRQTYLRLREQAGV